MLPGRIYCMGNALIILAVSISGFAQKILLSGCGIERNNPTKHRYKQNYREHKANVP